MFHHPWTILDYSGLTFPKAGTPACTFGTLGRTMRSKMDVSPSGVWPVAVVPWRQVLRSAMVGIAGLSSAGRSCLKSVKKHGNLWNQSQKLGYWNLKLEFKNHQDLWYPMSQWVKTWRLLENSDAIRLLPWHLRGRQTTPRKLRMAPWLLGGQVCSQCSKPCWIVRPSYSSDVGCLRGANPETSRNKPSRSASFSAAHPKDPKRNLLSTLHKIKVSLVQLGGRFA